MKHGLLILLGTLFLNSCDLIIVEEPFDPRLNFVGRYEAEEYSETFDEYLYYDVRVTLDDGYYSDIIYLENFYNLNADVQAEVYGNSITIPRQRIGNWLIQGTGHLEYGDLVLTYSVEDLNRPRLPVDFCNTIMYLR
ncbi:hypothetical protein [Roseivirga pacifica]|uniref:hypothetical protein n=1 Tax=Roseivirga pacifica TaxID=1267423 RepID=UPI00227C76A5|nr:hypothetical protein [Roseivirga pacifica]